MARAMEAGAHCLRLMGEYIAASAAAPQVVADERAAFEAMGSPRGYVRMSLDVCDLDYVDSITQAQWEGFQAGRAAAPVQAQEPEHIPVRPGHFPQRDPSKPAEQQGVFKKFDVWRTDGSSAPGGKHRECRYFVLDVDHDALAKPALQAYAAACAATHPDLSADMVKRFDLAPVQPVAVAVPDGGLREAVGKIIKAMESSAAPIDLAHALKEVSGQGGRIDFDADLMAELSAAYSAAPAAQDDDHVLTRDELAAYRKMAYDEGVSVGAAQGDAVQAAQIEDGYEGGMCIADPTRLSGTVHLHYISPEHAESAFEIIAEIIDAAIAAKAAS